jgi:hypothetical protein
MNKKYHAKDLGRCGTVRNRLKFLNVSPQHPLPEKKCLKSSTFIFRGEIISRVMKWKLFIMLKARGSHNGAEDDAGFLCHENIRGAIAPKLEPYFLSLVTVWRLLCLSDGCI